AARPAAAVAVAAEDVAPTVCAAGGTAGAVATDAASAGAALGGGGGGAEGEEGEGEAESGEGQRAAGTVAHDALLSVSSCCGHPARPARSAASLPPSPRTPCTGSEPRALVERSGRQRSRSGLPWGGSGTAEGSIAAPRRGAPARSPAGRRRRRRRA